MSDTPTPAAWKHDGVRSEFPADFLWQIAQTEGREVAPKRRLWDRASMGEKFPTMPFEQIMSEDAGLLRWLGMVEEYGFALVGVAIVEFGDKPAAEQFAHIAEAARLLGDFHRQQHFALLTNLGTPGLPGFLGAYVSGAIASMVVTPWAVAAVTEMYGDLRLARESLPARRPGE